MTSRTLRGKLGQLIEEEQAIVSEGNFAGTGNDAAADESGVGDGVVRRAEGTLGNEAGRGIEHSGDGVDLGGLERFFKSERRKDRRQTFGEHRLAGAGRADHENVVAAGGGDLECTLGGLLTANVFEVDGEMLQLAEELFEC